LIFCHSLEIGLGSKLRERGAKKAESLRTPCARLIEELHMEKDFVAAIPRKQLGEIPAFQQESSLVFRLRRNLLKA